MAENSPMKRSDSMLTRVEEYLRYRRALGYALRIEGDMLLNFARFADKGGIAVYSPVIWRRAGPDFLRRRIDFIGRAASRY